MRFPILLLLLAALPGAASSQQYTISTIAGAGLPANVPAISTSLPIYVPFAVASDAAGNLFFPEQNSVVRVDAATGLLSVVAGNGTSGYSGDNGPATSAQFWTPVGVAVDPAGNLYLADAANNVIRKVSHGVITTVAGNGTQGTSCSDGPATGEGLNTPSGIAVDSAGNLYIADSGDNCVRKVANGAITTLAGTGQQGSGGDGGPATAAMLSFPLAVAVDRAGNVYVADSTNDKVRIITAANGGIATAAGSGSYGSGGDHGPAIDADLSSPSSLAVDSAGNLYIADTFNQCIREVTNGIITTIAGLNGAPGYSGDNGPATQAQLANPQGVAVDALGNIYIADFGNSRIRKASRGTIATVAGNGSIGDNGPASSAQLGNQLYLSVDGTGNVYIADYDYNRVRKISSATGTITTVAGNGTAGPSAPDGTPATSASLFSPGDVAVDAGGNLYVTLAEGARVVKVSSGEVFTLAGNGVLAGFNDFGSGDGGPASQAPVEFPQGIVADPSGNAYFVDRYNQQINLVRRISAGAIPDITTVAGAIQPTFSGDNGPAIGAELQAPYSLALDSDGNLYIAEADANKIRKVANGVIGTVAGDGQANFAGDDHLAGVAELNQPSGLAVDAAGNLYIADTRNNRIRMVSASTGIITTIAGNGPGFGGDGGPAIEAWLNGPTSVAVDAGGKVYIADSSNKRIRVLTPALPALSVSLSHTGNFPSGQAGAVYTIDVSNSGSAATNGPVTVNDSVPSGLTLMSMSGANWNCAAGACSRDDSLPAGGSYSPITVTVTVTAAAGSQVTNQAAATGGGSPPAQASDVTNIVSASQAPPSLGETQPAAGSGESQTFTFTFSDPGGYRNLQVVDVLINSALDGRRACYLAFAPGGISGGWLFLIDDQGDAAGPYEGLVLPANGSIANSQCTVNGSGSGASASGNTLTLTLAISFSAAFGGNKVIYTSAGDPSGHNSGWQAQGTWNVPVSLPAGPWVGGMSPSYSTNLTQAYTFTFTDTNGFQDIAVADILVNGAIDGRHACYVAFAPSGANGGSVFLVDDAGDAGGPYSGMLLPGSGSVSNSQCTIRGTGSAVNGSGNTLTLTLAMTFPAGFAGNQVFFLAARNNNGQNSEWQAVGTVAVP